jgi:hypothetical protein
MLDCGDKAIARLSQSHNIFGRRSQSTNLVLMWPSTAVKQKTKTAKVTVKKEAKLAKKTVILRL